MVEKRTVLFVDDDKVMPQAIDRCNLQNQRELGQFVTKGDSDD